MFKKILEKCYECFACLIVSHWINPNSTTYRIIQSTLDKLYERVVKDV